MSVAADGFNFILFFIFHKVQWWSGVVFSMFFCFTIWGKKQCMEHGVDSPLMGEGEFVRHWRYHLSDREGSMPLWG